MEGRGVEVCARLGVDVVRTAVNGGLFSGEGSVRRDGILDQWTGEQEWEDQVEGDIGQAMGKRYSQQGAEALDQQAKYHGDSENKDHIQD